MLTHHSAQAISHVGEYQIRKAVAADLDRLVALEQSTFTGDRLSRRRFRYWLVAGHGILLVATDPLSDAVVAYVLAFSRRNSSIARVYSLAVASRCRGRGLARKLLLQTEMEARKRNLLALRLEVAENNTTARGLYAALGYQEFTRIPAYYEDGQNAIRMQKSLAAS